MSREFPKNPEPKIALPTVGRIVWIYSETRPAPLAAIVAEANERLTITSACVFLPIADVIFEVLHKSEAQSGRLYWDWMPYQKGQAAKTEELERLVQSAGPGATGGPKN